MFGRHAYKLAMSSTKSMYGHPLGASGGIEAVACIKAMAESWMPPTLGLDQADPECDLDYVPSPGRKVEIEHAVCNCIAFGSKNSALVLRKAA